MNHNDATIQHEIISRKDAMAKGLKRYFTGKPCKNGHVVERRAVDGKCVNCIQDKDARYRLKNRDSLNYASANYYLKNRDRIKERKANYLLKNRDHIANYLLKNRDAIRDRNKIKVDNLSRSYIANILGIPLSILTDELYELKVQQVIIHRLKLTLEREIKELVK